MSMNSISISISHSTPFVRPSLNCPPKFFPKISTSTVEIKASSRNQAAAEEVRVCTNRTCRRQGSFETLHILSGIAPPNVAVNSCGCLGRCGAGPNVVVLPAGVIVGHCGTPSKAAHLMISVAANFDSSDDDEKGKICLEALALRKRAEDKMASGDFDEARVLLSQAIELKPFGGVHMLYKYRSAARLGVGKINEALEDANEALAIAPWYPEAYICQGDALMAMDQHGAAENSYFTALDIDPSLRRSKTFKARIAKLQDALAPADLA